MLCNYLNFLDSTFLRYWYAGLYIKILDPVKKRTLPFGRANLCESEHCTEMKAVETLLAWLKSTPTLGRPIYVGEHFCVIKGNRADKLSKMSFTIHLLTLNKIQKTVPVVEGKNRAKTQHKILSNSGGVAVHATAYT